MKDKLLKKRWKRAHRIAWFLQITPFIRMIGVNGSMTTGKITEKSDIDFLAVVKPGRIFTARFFITFLTHITGKRRHGQKIAGRVCLNRYHTDNFLEIFPHDEYHEKVFSKLFPILDLDNFYEKYKKANSWMKNCNFENNQYPKVKLSKILNFKRKALEWILSGRFGDFLERKLSSWQRKRIEADIRTLKAPVGRVRVSDKELCFHPLKEK